MIGNDDLIRKLMVALNCDYGHAKKQVTSFIYTITLPEKVEYSSSKQVNHQDGWYRKFDKPNKRK
jgi:hypothetical protein